VVGFGDYSVPIVFASFFGPVQKISSVPRMKKYYGWLTLNGQVFRGLRPRLKPPVITVSKITRSMSPDKDSLHRYCLRVPRKAKTTLMISKSSQFLLARPVRNPAGRAYSDGKHNGWWIKSHCAQWQVLDRLILFSLFLL
jgi:hypothetical protein